MSPGSHPRPSARRGMTLSLLNMKGGVAKTTLAVNIAWHLCRFGHKRVLLIDLDPQFNASQYLMSPSVWDSHRKDPGTVADVLLEPHKPEMRLRKRTTAPRVDLRRFLYSVEQGDSGSALLLLPSELVLAKAIKSPEGVPYKLEKALQPVRSEFDRIIIDCAPTDSVLTDTALMASDFVLVPMKPDRFSVLGYALMQETLDSFRNTYPDPHQTKDLGVVFAQVSGESGVEQDCMAEIQGKAEYVFQAQIRRKVRTYAKSVQERRPIFDTSYAREATKRELTRLVEELEQRIAQLSEHE